MYKNVRSSQQRRKHNYLWKTHSFQQPQAQHDFPEKSAKKDSTLEHETSHSEFVSGTRPHGHRVIRHSSELLF